MSYCRFSSDDYQCDVYVWHDYTDVWRTEVAGRRRIWKVALPSPVQGEPGTERWARAFMRRAMQVSELLRDESNFDWQTIPEPEGGRSYDHDTPGECAENLGRLRELGLNVPQYAIDELGAEQRDLASAAGVALTTVQRWSKSPAVAEDGGAHGPGTLPDGRRRGTMKA